MSRDFVEESSIRYWLGPVSRWDCGCPLSGPHGIDCRNHPDRVAEDELRFDLVRPSPAPSGGNDGRS